jgi:hypothetical protein
MGSETAVKKRCLRCGRQFVPAKKHYRYCQTCYSETRPLGHTTSRQRPGGAARIHGGISRTTNGRRPVVLRGEVTTREIVQGLQAFLTDLYRRPTRISALLRDAGMGESEIEYLRGQRRLKTFALRFCPELWEWLGTEVGSKARDVVVNCYGLYGGERCEIQSIARDLGITTNHAQALRRWALKQIRDSGKRSELEEMVVSTARSILAAREESR